jgi:hypothetical protein
MPKTMGRVEEITMDRQAVTLKCRLSIELSPAQIADLKDQLTKTFFSLNVSVDNVEIQRTMDAGFVDISAICRFDTVDVSELSKLSKLFSARRASVTSANYIRFQHVPLSALNITIDWK